MGREDKGSDTENDSRLQRDDYDIDESSTGPLSVFYKLKGEC